MASEFEQSVLAKLKRLPPERQREVLDFVDALERRTAAQPSSNAAVASPDAAPLWPSSLYDTHQMPSAKELQGILIGCAGLIREADWPNLDALYAGLEPRRLHPQAMNGLLRAVYRHREQLPHWQTFLNEVRGELTYRNLNIEEWLFGLDGKA